MPLLSCTAKTCLYNKNEYCSKGDIQVDGPNAQRPDETCCKSFVEKKEGAMNSMETGTATSASASRAMAFRLLPPSILTSLKPLSDWE